MSLFGAAWTVGSLAAMATSSVDRVTYYETVGWRGVMETETGSPLPDQFRSIPGSVYPLYHVLADVAGCAGAPVFFSETSDSGKIGGFAFERDGVMRILLANLTAETQEVTVHHGGESVQIQMLNEHTAVAAMRTPEEFRREERSSIRPAHGQTALRMLPYAVARLDVEAT
jgi:D-apionolactonase